MNKYNEYHDCQMCGKKFIATSMDDKYCSNECERREGVTDGINWYNYI